LAIDYCDRINDRSAHLDLYGVTAKILSKHAGLVEVSYEDEQQELVKGFFLGFCMAHGL
jgi:hypothetical protein